MWMTLLLELSDLSRFLFPLLKFSVSRLPLHERCADRVSLLKHLLMRRTLFLTSAPFTLHPRNALFTFSNVGFEGGELLALLINSCNGMPGLFEEFFMQL